MNFENIEGFGRSSLQRGYNLSVRYLTHTEDYAQEAHVAATISPMKAAPRELSRCNCGVGIENGTVALGLAMTRVWGNLGTEGLSSFTKTSLSFMGGNEDMTSVEICLLTPCHTETWKRLRQCGSGGRLQ